MTALKSLKFLDRLSQNLLQSSSVVVSQTSVNFVASDLSFADLTVFSSNNYTVHLLIDYVFFKGHIILLSPTLEQRNGKKQ